MSNRPSSGKLSSNDLFRMWSQDGSPKFLLKELCYKSGIEFPEDDFDKMVSLHKEKSKSKK